MKVCDVCSPSRRREIPVPLSRLVPPQTERPACKLDCSRRCLMLPADALVCRRRKTKCGTAENPTTHLDGALKGFCSLCSEGGGLLREVLASLTWNDVPEKAICFTFDNWGVVPEGRRRIAEQKSPSGGSKLLRRLRPSVLVRRKLTVWLITTLVKGGET